MKTFLDISVKQRNPLEVSDTVTLSHALPNNIYTFIDMNGVFGTREEVNEEVDYNEEDESDCDRGTTQSWVQGIGDYEKMSQQLLSVQISQ